MKEKRVDGVKRVMTCHCDEGRLLLVKVRLPPPFLFVLFCFCFC